MTHNTPTRDERLAALFAAPLLHRIAAEIPTFTAGRPRRHPIALHLARGAMQRLWGSGNRLDPDLRRGTWQRIHAAYRAGAIAADTDPGPEILPVLEAHTYRHTRDHLCHPDVLTELTDAFIRHSAQLATDIGLLNPNIGSRTHPHPTRTIYGDGTVIRPMYNPNTTRERNDNDAITHHRFDGPITGTNLVHMSVRGPEPHQRVVLTAATVNERGAEAATAIEALTRIHRTSPDGAQAVVYDGAMRGTHFETIYRNLGWIPITKVHPITNNNGIRTWRNIPIGTYQHAAGQRTCTHTLITHNGAVHDAAIHQNHTELGEPLTRHQIRRYPCANNRYRFSLGITVPCPHGTFTAWIAPHPRRDQPAGSLTDQLRLIPPTDPDFAPLYGLRNDAEAINSEYKNTLPWNRAQQLGAPRQHLDFLCWALTNNTLTWARHHPETQPRRGTYGTFAA